MAFSRASSLDRDLLCAGGQVLGGIDLRGESARVAADWGTMVHHWKETGEVITVNGRDNLPPLFRKKLEATGVRRENYWPSTMIHETALAVNPFRQYAENTNGTREQKDAWKQAFGDEWCTGTGDGADWMFDVLWVDDLKTGKQVSLEEHIQQLRFYALGVSRVIGYRGPVHVTLTHWPRYPVLSMPQRFGRVIEQDELLAFEKELAHLRDTILWARDGGKIEEELEPGEKQCTWCPARSNCPALMKGN